MAEDTGPDSKVDDGSSLLSHKQRVYIVESPSPEDCLDGRQEGKTLMQALQLAGTTVDYYNVVNRECLVQCFKRIEGSMSYDEWVDTAPYLYLSAHGDKDGIRLTSGEDISWPDLARLLKEMGKVRKYLALCMSTCAGFHAIQMVMASDDDPCYALVGPGTQVQWEESLTAYITFFHLLTRKGFSAWDAAKAMNESAGLKDVFKTVAFKQWRGIIDAK